MRYRLLLISLLALLLAACGVDDDAGPFDPNVEATLAVPATEGIAEPVEQPPLQGEGEGDGSSTVAAFDVEIPLPEGSQLVEAEQDSMESAVNEGVYRATYIAPLPADAVLSYYEAALPAMGYELEERVVEAGQNPFLTFEGEEAKVLLTVLEEDSEGGTRFNLTIQPLDG